MSTWVVTDPKATRIYGTVEVGEVGNEVQVCQAVDRGRAVWFWQSEPGPHDQRSVHHVRSLAGDGRWRELGTSTPLPGGDVGGDGQDSESFSRRFGLVRADGTWAVVTVSWYTVNDAMRRADDQARAEDFWLERQEEYVIARDVHDLGGTEIFGEDRYLKELSFPITESGALLAAADFDFATEISWDGEEFRG